MRKNVMKLTAGVLSTAVLAGMFATGTDKDCSSNGTLE